MTKGPLDLVRQVAGILDDLDIPYAVGGSMASSLFGEPRMTVDVDIAIRLASGREAGLLERTETEFYVPREAARIAMRTHASFNLLDIPSVLKVDLFVLGDGLLDRLQIDRRIRVTLPEPDFEIWVTSPEVQVLKLGWFLKSDSDRQWRDVVGILRTTGTIDTDFLLEIAREVGLEDLLTDALDEAAS